MGSPKDKKLEQAQAEFSDVTRKQYGMALPMIQQGMQQGLEGSLLPGVPFIGPALEQKGTSMIDAAIDSSRRGTQAYLRAAGPAIEGGNTSDLVAPAIELADARSHTGIQEALASIRHRQSMLGRALGVASTGGAGAAAAGALELQSINNMATVNPALLAALAAVNTGYAAYRGLSKPKGVLGDGRAFTGGIGTAQVGDNGLLEMGGNE